VISEPEEQATPLKAVAPPPLPAASIGFSNSRAVWISMVVAGFALFCLGAIGMFAPALMPVVLCGAGFGAVTIYQQRATEPLTASAGARLGWMTGLWLFLIFVMLLAFFSVAIADPTTREKLRAVSMPEVAKLLDNPHDFILQIVQNLFMSFFFLTLLPGLGGILGAKLLTWRRHSS
jgi:hypothetical protein